MEKKNLMRKLYEQVRAYDDLLDIPDTVKYSGNTSIKNLLKDVEEFNRLPNDKSSLKECKRLFNNAMRTLAEILDAHEALNYDYKLQLKKKINLLMTKKLWMQKSLLMTMKKRVLMKKN